MRKMLSVLFSSELKWWRSLSAKEKLYTMYFLASFMLVVGLAESNPMWVILPAVLNFGNSARLIKRVPVDKLEED